MKIREQSLFLSIDDFVKNINNTIDEQGFVSQKTFEDIFYQTINRDREYMINFTQNEIEKLQKEIKRDIKNKNKLARIYAITVNQISLKNNKIRRKIEEKGQLLVSKDDFKEKKKLIQNLYDQIFFLFTQFENTILEIKDKKSKMKDEIQSLRAEFASISSNNLVTLRNSNFKIKKTYENLINSKKYEKEQILLNEQEKIKRKINKYKFRNCEYDNCFREIIDILGKFSLDPKSFLLDFRKKTFEEQIAQQISDDYSDSKTIAEMLKAKCDLIFTNKDNEINEIFKKMEIKETQMKEKIRLTILNCGIQKNKQINSPPSSNRYSPRYSPNRDPVDILINHKSLKFASWEESSKLLNQTFNEIERLRRSRMNESSGYNSNDSIE